MKIILFAFLTTILCLSASAQELTPKDIFLKAQQELLKHKNVEYLATAKFKFLNSDDTIQVKGTSQILREESDSLFGGKIYYMPQPTLGRLYDLKNIYQIDFQTKAVVKFDPQTVPGALKDYGSQAQIIWNDFLKPNLFAKRIDYSPVLLKDTIIDGRECYQIRTALPDNPDNITWRCFTKDALIPVLFKNQVLFRGNYQYTELQIHSWDFTRPNDITIYSKIPLSFKIEQYVAPIVDSERILNLAVGSTAPLLSGKNLKNNLKKETVVFQGKVTLLDFWYMSCPPCIEAIPEIEKIYEKYASKGLQVIGINSKDNNDADFKRLPKFLSHNPIQYPILFVESALPQQYAVSVWPTFYIIDKEGKIRYAEPGFGGNMAQEMDELIGKLLE